MLMLNDEDKKNKKEEDGSEEFEFSEASEELQKGITPSKDED